MYSRIFLQVDKIVGYGQAIIVLYFTLSLTCTRGSMVMVQKGDFKLLVETRVLGPFIPKLGFIEMCLSVCLSVGISVCRTGEKMT